MQVISYSDIKTKDQFKHISILKRLVPYPYTLHQSNKFTFFNHFSIHFCSVDLRLSEIVIFFSHRTSRDVLILDTEDTVCKIIKTLNKNKIKEKNQNLVQLFMGCSNFLYTVFKYF